MKYPYIKNIAHEEALALSGQVVTQPGQIVSKTLAQNGAVSITLFAFDKDEEISTHDSDGDAMATVLEGTGQFTVDGRIHLPKSRMRSLQKNNLRCYSLSYSHMKRTKNNE